MAAYNMLSPNRPSCGRRRPKRGQLLLCFRYNSLNCSKAQLVTHSNMSCLCHKEEGPLCEVQSLHGMEGETRGGRNRRSPRNIVQILKLHVDCAFSSAKNLFVWLAKRKKKRVPFITNTLQKQSTGPTFYLQGQLYVVRGWPDNKCKCILNLTVFVRMARVRVSS